MNASDERSGGSDTRITRRDTLRGAAAALAVGLGSPAVLFAARAEEASEGTPDRPVFAFYKHTDLRQSRPPFYSGELSEDAWKTLADEGNRLFLKVEWADEHDVLFELQRK